MFDDLIKKATEGFAELNRRLDEIEKHLAAIEAKVDEVERMVNQPRV